GIEHVPNAQAVGSQNVALLAVHVVEQGNTSGAVWIVFDRCHARRHAGLVALEVDNSVLALVTAALVAGGDAALIVPAGSLLEGTKQRLFGLRPGNLAEGRDGHAAPARRGWLVLLDRHLYS